MDTTGRFDRRVSAVVFVWLLFLSPICGAQEFDCSGCHEPAGLTESVHADVACGDCHTNIVDRRHSRVVIESEVTCRAATGAEMEAIVAVLIAAATIYDMCKAVDREMRIGAVELLEKSGGRSGTWRRSRKRREE